MIRPIADFRRRFSYLLFGGSAVLLIVLLVIDQQLLDTEQWVGVFWILFSAGLFIFILTLSYQLANYTAVLTRYIDKMKATAHEMARGDLERLIDTDSIQVRELQKLGEEINAMATRARTDITEMKRLERVRSEFLGNVSHELRTPIFTVQGFLETLIDGAVEDPSVRDEFLNKAHQNVLRLHSLLTDLIEISRIESGAMKMSFRYFDIVKHCQTVITEMRPTAEMAGITLDLQVEGNGNGEISALGDRERIKQVMVNLIDNAIKYNHRGGSITIGLKVESGEVTISVCDTGIGIPPEAISRIFERFYRVDKDRSRAVGGSGLGLAIVKHIIEAHGSKITVESEMDKGTTFRFALKR